MGYLKDSFRTLFPSSSSIDGSYGSGGSGGGRPKHPSRRSLIAAMEERELRKELELEEEQANPILALGNTASITLAQSSRNMFHNIGILTSKAPIPDSALLDMGCFPQKNKDKKRRRRRRTRRILGMKPPHMLDKEYEVEGDGLFRI